LLALHPPPQVTPITGINYYNIINIKTLRENVIFLIICQFCFHNYYWALNQYYLGMGRLQVAHGGTTSNIEGSCEYTK